MTVEDKMRLDPESHWNEAYITDRQREERDRPSGFAESVAEHLGPDDVVLELGCGIGVDAAYLSEHASSVTAVDFAERQMQENREQFNQPNLNFETVDISQGLGIFEDGSFTAVYARRSLHYFDGDTTERIFEEISRVLAPGGQIFFECKSANDPHAGQDAEIGDVRHFFSTEELQELLPDFEIVHQEENNAEDFYGYPSVFLTCWARKQ